MIRLGGTASQSHMEVFKGLKTLFQRRGIELDWVLYSDYDALVEGPYLLLDITAEHAYHVGSLPLGHRDPFDRLLISQAQIERSKLVTRDAVFHDYDISILQA